MVTPSLEKTLFPLLEKILSSEQFVCPSTPPEIPSAGREKIKFNSTFVSLEQTHQLHQKLLDELRKSGAMKDQKSGESLQRQTLEPKAREILDQLIQGIEIKDRETRQSLVTETLNLAFGLGPLEPLLQNEEVTEIMVNGPRQIYVEKKGILEKTNLQFLNDQQLRTVIEENIGAYWPPDR